MKNDIQNRNDIHHLVSQFYQLALQDEQIGFFFTEIAKIDLETHVPKITDFWETMLFNSPAYASYGRPPILAHFELDQKHPLEWSHFKRWLELFEATVNALFEGPIAELAKTRARGIAGFMFQAIQQRRTVRV